jgi:hypothetical protein
MFCKKLFIVDDVKCIISSIPIQQPLLIKHSGENDKENEGAMTYPQDMIICST